MKMRTASGAMAAGPGSGFLGRLLRNRRGNALVEFALVAPVFFLAMFGTIDFGRMLWLASTVEHVAKEGARYAAIRGAEKIIPATESDVKNYVKGRTVGISPSDMTIDVAWDPDNQPGSTVTVTVDYQFEYLMIGFLPLDPVQLQGLSKMVIN